MFIFFPTGEGNKASGGRGNTHLAAIGIDEYKVASFFCESCTKFDVPSKSFEWWERYKSVVYVKVPYCWLSTCGCQYSS